MPASPALSTTPRPRGVVVSMVAAAMCAIVVAGCATRAPPPPPAPPPAPAAPTVAAQFIVAESMNDTWNTIGQVLATLDGARVGARAQMMGLTQLHWQGEPMLLVASALPITPESQGLRTRVRALTPEGAPLASDGAQALVRILAVRVAAEAPRYRQAIKLPGRPARVKKGGR